MSDARCVAPRFIQGTTNSLFIVEYRPKSKEQGIVLFAPPFAEEMNRSRRMISQQARVFAGLGYRVIVPDLSGTGDSHGEFATATWEIWCNDLVAVLDASGNPDNLPVIMWSLRSGALLAAQVVIEKSICPQMIILWSPCLSGQTYMTQFLRLRLLSSRITNSGNKESMAELKAILDAGESLEVAGYEISARLFRSIDEMDLVSQMADIGLPVFWYELVGNADSSMSAVASKAIEDLNGRGCEIRAEKAVGPNFWSTAELTMAQDLIDLTSKNLSLL